MIMIITIAILAIIQDEFPGIKLSLIPFYLNKFILVEL